MRLATIDVGTNTALLLIADVSARGGMRPVHEAERFVRLGEGVDASGRIGKAALERLGRVLLAYRETAERYRVTKVVVAGTSASRDARNGDALVEFVRRETGLDYEILSGEAEARWSFAGTVSDFPDLEGPCAVLDIGGGSTELVVGIPGGPPSFVHSFDVGSVRLAERYFDAQAPAPEAVVRAEAFVRQALDAGPPVPLHTGIPLVGTAGTPHCLAAVCGWSREAIRAGRASLDAGTVRSWRHRLLDLDYDAVMALAPDVMAGRADVFPAAVLILDLVLRRFEVPNCRVGVRGLRHGLALRFLEEVLVG